MKRFATVALAALLALPATSHAFSLDLDGVGNILHWVLGTGGSVPYRLAPGGNIPFGSEGEQAIHRAFASWSRASSKIEYRFDGYASQARMANDGQNVVLFIYDDWPYEPGFAALTFRYFDNRSGKLIDTDIAFNADRFNWSIGGSGFDIENSAAHEVGHFTGLGHSSVNDATMYANTVPTETSKRSLHSDDLSGISAIYGSGTSAPPTDDGGGLTADGGGSGGCSTGASAPGDALLAGVASVMLVLHGLWQRRRLIRRGRRTR